MRVLIDIVHPADVLFFLGPIRKLRAHGAQILVLSRHKDVACDLLDAFGITHTPVTRARSGIIGLAVELLERDLAVLGAVRRFRPDVMAGFGAVSVSHVGRVMGVPAISFYDSDTARLQALVTNPFISHVYVPEGYAGRLPEGRWSHFPGIKELSYFHPDSFRPQRDIAVSLGLDNERANIFLRTVAWKANHDLGKVGWNDQQIIALVEKLGALGKVHVCSERQLPRVLDPFRYRGSSRLIHHLMGFCDLYIGESATMAAESAVLAVPAIYTGVDDVCYLGILERATLLLRCRERDAEILKRVAESALADSREVWRERRDAFLAVSSNLADFVTARILDWGRSNEG